MKPYRAPAAEDARPTEAESGLGALRSNHPGPPLGLALLPAIVVVVILLAMGIALAIRLDVRVLVFVVPTAAVLFLLLAWTPLRRGRFSIELHDHGLAVLRGETRREILFDEVDEVWLELSIQGTSLGAFALIQAVRLVDRRGVRHSVPLPRDVRVARTILRECSESLLADARRALAGGESLRFADVALDGDGIRVGREGRTWDALPLVRFQPGRVVFFGSSRLFPWKVVRLDRVPHPTLFTTLVREHARASDVDDPLAG